MKIIFLVTENVIRINIYKILLKEVVWDKVYIFGYFFVMKL